MSNADLPAPITITRWKTVDPSGPSTMQGVSVNIPLLDLVRWGVDGMPGSGLGSMQMSMTADVARELWALLGDQLNAIAAGDE